MIYNCVKMRVDIDGIENKELNKLVSFKGKKILEVGCGIGRSISYYIDDALSVVAVDNDMTVLDIAKSRLERGKVTFICADFLDLTFKDKFDIIIFNKSLHHISDVENAILKSRNLLNDNGIIIVIEPMVNNYLNALMSIFDDENEELTRTYNFIKSQLIIEEKECGIGFEFQNINDLLYFLNDGDIDSIDKVIKENIEEYIGKYKKGNKIIIPDIWRFIVLK